VSWRRSWRPSTRGCTCSGGRRRRAWAGPTWPASGGHASRATTSSSRWTPTAPTHPSSCRASSALEDADLVLGSRYVPGGEVADWPLHRLLLSRAGNRYTRWALRLPLEDATGGFRAARSELIDRLPFDDVSSEGYCFQVDWAWRAVRAGARVVEVPITFTERTFGRSKMSGSIVGEALVRVTAWGLQDRLADHLPGRVRRPVPARTRPGGGEAGPA